MKRTLLCIAGIGLSVALSAQSKTSEEVSGLTISQKASIAMDEAQAPYSPSSNKVMGTLIGNGPNAYGPAFGPRTNVWADPALDAIVFIHRSDAAANGDAGSGSFRYDASTDGGATWDMNVGPIYNGGDGRYPLVVIANPAGNTTPSNAFVVASGPSLSGSNGSWGGVVFAADPLGANTPVDSVIESDTADNVYNLIANSMWYTPDGTVHMIEPSTDANADYVDTLLYRRASVTGGALSYTLTKIPFPVYDDVTGGTGKIIYDCNIAFSPDGQTGYISSIANIPGGPGTVGSQYPVMMKTTDGGLTWSQPVGVDITTLFSGTLPQVPADSSLTCGFDSDLTVDANGVAHFSSAIGAEGSTAYSIGTAPGFIGIFSVRFDGNNATGDLVSLTQTFRGTFGTLTEDNRSQVSNSPNSDVILYTFFDTDTLLYGVFDNDFPNAYTRAYYTSDGTWGPVISPTLGTADDGITAFGCVGNYAFDDGNNGYTVHIVRQELQQNDDLLPTTYHYIAGAYNTVGIEDKELAMSNLYPNPATSAINFEVNLNADSDVRIQVLNTLGQVVYQSTERGNAGAQSFSVDVNDLNAGIYVLEVQAAGLKTAQQFIVK